MALPILWFSTSGLQSYETINVCGLNPPSLGNQYIREIWKNWNDELHVELPQNLENRQKTLGMQCWLEALDQELADSMATKKEMSTTYLANIWFFKAEQTTLDLEKKMSGKEMAWLSVPGAIEVPFCMQRRGMMSTLNTVNVPRRLVLFEFFFSPNITDYFLEEWEHICREPPNCQSFYSNCNFLLLLICCSGYSKENKKIFLFYKIWVKMLIKIKLKYKAAFKGHVITWNSKTYRSILYWFSLKAC